MSNKISESDAKKFCQLLFSKIASIAKSKDSGTAESRVESIETNLNSLKLVLGSRAKPKKKGAKKQRKAKKDACDEASCEPGSPSAETA